MQLSLKTAVIGILSLASTSSGFVVTVYSNPDCTGTAREINVYDNTCRAPISPGFAAFKVKTYGSSSQRAYFFRAGGCGDLASAHQWWSDGGSDTFKADGRCLTEGPGTVWNAIASYFTI
ncbi:hypothetical protein BDV18DRAFT_156192 [Aspergillus unguis]